MQKTHQSALQVQQKAEALLQAGHYDADAIRECAEKVALHWQQLMLKMEDRLKLVNASVAFYKTSEQVREGLGDGGLMLVEGCFFPLILLTYIMSLKKQLVLSAVAF